MIDERVTIRLPAEMAARLRYAAKVRHVSVAEAVRNALEDQEKTQGLAAKIEQVLQVLERGGIRGPTAVVSQHSGPGAPVACEVRKTDLPAGDGVRSEEDLIRDMDSILGTFGADDE